MANNLIFIVTRTTSTTEYTGDWGLPPESQITLVRDRRIHSCRVTDTDPAKWEKELRISDVCIVRGDAYNDEMVLGFFECVHWTGLGRRFLVRMHPGLGGSVKAPTFVAELRGIASRYPRVGALLSKARSYSLGGQTGTDHPISRFASVVRSGAWHDYATSLLKLRRWTFPTDQVLGDDVLHYIVGRLVSIDLRILRLVRAHYSPGVRQDMLTQLREWETRLAQIRERLYAVPAADPDLPTAAQLLMEYTELHGALPASAETAWRDIRRLLPPTGTADDPNELFRCAAEYMRWIAAEAFASDAMPPSIREIDPFHQWWDAFLGALDNLIRAFE